MINSTNSFTIDGSELDKEKLQRILNLDNTDTFTRWVLRPIAALTVIGLTLAGLFASVFFIAVSLALLPVLALAMWAMKKKIEQELKATDPIVDTQATVKAEEDPLPTT
ncbi:MAG: hypothetical protein AB8B63_24300 [Granulosicoccus sp.]